MLGEIGVDLLGEVLFLLCAKDALSALLSCRHLRDVWRTRPDMPARWLWNEHLGGLQPSRPEVTAVPRVADDVAGTRVRRHIGQQPLLVVLTRALESKQTQVLSAVVQRAGAHARWSVAAATSFGWCVDPEQTSFVTGVLGF